MHQDKTLISVVLAVYNLELYVERAIQSFIQCRADEFAELIIVNDGSTDRTSEICEKYLSRQDVRIITKDHSGLAAARNTGNEKSMGDYVVFLDGDDSLDEGLLQKLKLAIKEGGDVDLFYYNWQEINNRTCILVQEYDAMKTVAVWNKCYKKAFLDKNQLRFSESCLFEDIGYSPRAFVLSNKVRHISGKPLYYYHVRPDSASHRFVTAKDRLSAIRALKKLERELLPILQSDQYADMITIYIMDCWWFHIREFLKEEDDHGYVLGEFIQFLCESIFLKSASKFNFKTLGLKKSLLCILITRMGIKNRSFIRFLITLS
ncbi:glycosyltransferase [Weissella cibaria]|uniref:glycosyltransferase n=1 Tax=Weissella cibaria TaxID=137591 RepID=UPI0016812C80|nr:glycosyltransferase [Weissella cibaria]MBD1503041.1 glycosyltransferase [Weissella cibaria]MCG4287517.1 glycosyltransferase [Weissella cibaria]